MAPVTGLEPVTSWLTVKRSTDWAKQEYLLKFEHSWDPILLRCKLFRNVLPTELNRKIWNREVSKILLCKCRRRSIFPRRYHLSIFDAGELNYCVRNGNRWTLTAKDTDKRKNKRFSQNWTTKRRDEAHLWKNRISPRPISTRKLNASQRLHIKPINLVVYKGS